MRWGFFDGATGGDPTRCGGGAVLHFDLQNYITLNQVSMKALTTLQS